LPALATVPMTELETTAASLAMMMWHEAPFQVPRLNPIVTLGSTAVSVAVTEPPACDVNGCGAAPLMLSVPVKTWVCGAGGGGGGVVGGATFCPPHAAAETIADARAHPRIERTMGAPGIKINR